MNQLRNKFMNFMRGRYGMDPFGTFLFWVGLTCNIVYMFSRNPIVNVLVWVIWIYMLYRFFSKNFVKRSIENQNYQKYKMLVRRRWKVLKLNFTDKQYKYYLCPKCHQMVSVPRGHGKVTITCPTCHYHFEKNS